MRDDLAILGAHYSFEPKNVSILFIDKLRLSTGIMIGNLKSFLASGVDNIAV